MFDIEKKYVFRLRFGLEINFNAYCSTINLENFNTQRLKPVF